MWKWNFIKLWEEKYKNEKAPEIFQGFLLSDRDRIRTCDRLLRRQMLYPAELRDHQKLAANLVFFSSEKILLESNILFV